MALPFLILSTTVREPALASAGGYRAGGVHRPLAAALSLTIAGGVGATLMLALVIPEVVEVFDEPWTTIRVEPVEPEPTPDPAPQTQPQTTQITAVRRPYDTPTSSEAPIGDIITDPLPPIAYIPPDFGGAAGGTIADPPRPPVFRSATRDPGFARSFQPPYPSAHERNGVEGRCPITVTIAPSGRVTNVASNGCDDPLFFAATQRQALNRWHFRPATRDGVAVESTQNVAVSFEIPVEDRR